MKGKSKVVEEQLIRAIYQFAANMMEAGVPDREIEEILVDKGLNREDTITVVTQLSRLRSRARRRAVLRRILGGGAVCIIGVVVIVWLLGAYGVTMATIGFYVVTWLGVVWGGLQILRGMGQYS